MFLHTLESMIHSTKRRFCYVLFVKTSDVAQPVPVQPTNSNEMQNITSSRASSLAPLVLTNVLSKSKIIPFTCCKLFEVIIK